jgi:hypothetical protein
LIEQRYGIIPKSGVPPAMVINMRALAFNPLLYWILNFRNFLFESRFGTLYFLAN